MKQAQLTRAQTISIMAGAALMLSLSMGMRQSFGLLQPHVVRDIAITAADFSLAIAIQNIVWGVTQPFVGMLADRAGVRRVMIAGVIIYAAGLVVMALSQSALMFTIGAGVCIGLALSCTGSNLAMNVAARSVSVSGRFARAGAGLATGAVDDRPWRLAARAHRLHGPGGGDAACRADGRSRRSHRHRPRHGCGPDRGRGGA
jgi:MFS family permease